MPSRNDPASATQLDMRISTFRAAEFEDGEPSNLWSRIPLRSPVDQTAGSVIPVADQQTAWDLDKISGLLGQ